LTETLLEGSEERWYINIGRMVLMSEFQGEIVVSR